MEWQKNYGGSEYDSGSGVVVNQNGEFIIVGTTVSEDFDINNNYGSSDLWILKLTAEGVLIYEKNMGGTSEDFGYSIVYQEENKFIVTGLSRSNNNDVIDHIGDRDMWVVMIDENITSLVDQEITKENIKIYPNPNSGGILQIQNLNLIMENKFSIYNNLGTLIYGDNIPQNKIDISRLPTGIYWLTISNSDYIQTQKLIVNK